MRTTEVTDDFAETRKIEDVEMTSEPAIAIEQKIEDENCDFKRK